MSGSASTNTDGAFFDTDQLANVALFSTALVNAGTSDNETYLGDASGLVYVNLLGTAAVITATADNDQLNDTAFGGAGDDQMHGMGGDDVLDGGNGDDVLYGGLGDISAALITVSIVGLADGPSGNDSLNGGIGNDTAYGQDGNDTIIGGEGDDSLDGGADTDLLDYSSATGGVSLNLASGIAADGLGGTDRFANFESFILSDQDDVVIDTAGDQEIYLGAGDDSYAWAGGDDTVHLGAGGNDTVDLAGWTGDDTDNWSTVNGGDGSVVFTNSGGGSVRVYDYNATDDTIACFASGTRILTPRGEVPVEELRAGDLVVTMQGGPKLTPLIWVGRSCLDLSRHRDRRAAAPVLIRAGALGEGIPCRDLRVSPDHALLVEGRLVPARLLVNGRGIVQELFWPEVTYHHLEIEGHGLLVSEGAVTESYFDDGNRAMFDNARLAWMAGGFDAARDHAHYAEAACVPVLLEGPELDRLRVTLLGRDAARAAIAA